MKALNVDYWTSVPRNITRRRHPVTGNKRYIFTLFENARTFDLVTDTTDARMKNEDGTACLTQTHVLRTGETYITSRLSSLFSSLKQICDVGITCIFFTTDVKQWTVGVRCPQLPPWTRLKLYISFCFHFANAIQTSIRSGNYTSLKSTPKNIQFNLIQEHLSIHYNSNF